VNLVVKRRVVLPAPPEPQNIRVTLLKNKKKDGEEITINVTVVYMARYVMVLRRARTMTTRGNGRGVP
jgi:hypothetical protein